MKDMIPEAALDKHIAFLGATGSGKTSGAKRAVVEPALEAGERVVIIDPTGAWWGLRVAKDGRGKGLPIYIFGGDHGDYPLRAHDAATLAEAFATSTDSAVFDTSLMTVTDRSRFFIEFAETLRRKNRGALKVIIDEAHLFMPQSGAKSGGHVPEMLHAGNNLVSLGRSRGLRITLISQRPAKLHKDSLTQVQSLVAMRLLAPQDRKAISDWISDQADAEKGPAIIASLPGLKPGDAWVWSPLDNYLQRVHFPLPITFDSSRAPGRHDGEGPKLTPINLDALREKLATVEKETLANDPKILRAENDRLKKMLSVKASDVLAVSRAREEGYQRGRAALAEEITQALNMARGSIENVIEKCAYPHSALMPMMPGAPSDDRHPLDGATLYLDGCVTQVQAERMSREDLRQCREAKEHMRPRAATFTAVNLPTGEAAILTALAMYPGGCDHGKIAVLTGYKETSRRTYLTKLASRGYCTNSGGRSYATPDGIAALGDRFEPLPTGDALREYWLRRLPEGERKILSVLLDFHPDSVDASAIDKATGYRETSRRTYLTKLSARDLAVSLGRGQWRAADTLFEAA